MEASELFVIMYTCIWASLITIFVFYCALSHCMTIDDAVLISNAAFFGVTSVMVFIKPVRRWVNKNIISKL
jgi:hypothetical protein